MRLFKVAAALALVSSAAVIIDCDFRDLARVSKMSVTEEADGYLFTLVDRDGVPITATLDMGRRGEFTKFEIFFPKANGVCGTNGSPATEMWCNGGTALNAVATRANGTQVGFAIDAPWLDLAIIGGLVPNRVAYRIFGGRQLSPTQSVSGAQNGSYSGPVCHR